MERLSFSSHFAQERRIIPDSLSYDRMVGIERFLSDTQRALVEGLGLGILALIRVEEPQIVERVSDIGMIKTQRLLPEMERALVEGLGLGILVLLRVEVCQIVERESYLVMVRTQRLLLDMQAL